ncbi:radical SAM protein [Bacillus swezeyi]|uniref:Radical SAM/SPASM domain-containing protein n=1 Tax=Bacillus swezeyi TaxID=1925020 RepID=A0A1R1Q7A0_9BACI|nr:radical SAM protein [Bacillus swezeyi]MEC1261482.1 radical SAM protein [Bacillus swezeyi]MED2926655.1 radical SAM protein [Bacillus swezeyi]MED2944127.1 radical SAM protein [Bacillus swezeyi]MED2965783.1 radical SAM protein [Bacillus swezeyi]MED2978402.1 radical SAM protein [Bacillus swezeyi]
MIELKGYLVWNEKLLIRKFANNYEAMLVVKRNPTETAPTLKNENTFTINQTALEIIQLINGTKTYNEIVYLLSSKYNENPLSVKEKLTSFFENVSKLYNLNIDTIEQPKKVPVNLIEEKTIYPKVASIEITNRCNVRCRHCYGDFGEVKPAVMSLDQVKSLLDDLKEIGVQLIELTGGDITVHPDLKEILLYALELEFAQISLLTNGIALSNKVMDIIIKNTSRTFVQIDMHSLDNNYLTWFFKVPKTLAKIQNNIMKLAENNVRLRIATIVTHLNVHEVEDIAEWVHSLGIESFGVSPVVPMGRAHGCSDLYLNEKDLKTYGEALLKINNKYPKFLTLYQGVRSEIRNCGAITSHVVISPTGDIKICTMHSLDDLSNRIGNVFEKNIREIYDEKIKYINAFFNLQAPQIDSEECKNCEHKQFCSTCFLRSFLKAKEIGDKCAWFKKRVPEIIKEPLLIGQN